MLSRALGKFVIDQVASSGAEVMERGEFMSTPHGKPVGPAQEQRPFRRENPGDVLKELIGFRQMLIDIRANHEVVLPQAGQIVLVDIKPQESRPGKLRQEVLGFIRKGDLAAAFCQHGPKNTVAAPQIESGCASPDFYPPSLKPKDSVFGLKPVKPRIIPVPQVLLNQPKYDHVRPLAWGRT
jgi:hypothetical protein